MSTGESIKNFRLHHGLLQKDLAIIAGVSNKTVSAWEKGRIEPRMGAIQKIADHFGIKKSDIIESPIIAANEEMINVTFEEKELVEEYRELSDKAKSLIKVMIGQLKDVVSIN